MGVELRADTKLFPLGIELGRKYHPAGGELSTDTKSYPLGSESVTGFSPQLSWSHYRALMRVENKNARAAKKVSDPLQFTWIRRNRFLEPLFNYGAI
jgi:hypothetical protein